jgi:hypothetical protein
MGDDEDGVDGLGGWLAGWTSSSHASILVYFNLAHLFAPRRLDEPFK